MAFEERPPTTRQHVAFGALALVHAGLIAAISLIALGLPAIREEMGLEETQLTLITAGYGLAFSGLLILGGRLGDAWGPRRTFAAGTALFGVASLAGALAPDYPLLLAARFVQGAGASLAAPAALTLAGALFGPDRRRWALAVWGSLSAAGAVAGLLLSGPIVAWFGWRWAFAPPVLVSLVTLAAFGAFPDLFPRVAAAPPPRLDAPGGFLVTAGLSALTYGVLALTGETAPQAAWAVTALGVSLLALFIAVERRTPYPLLPLSFFQTGQRRLALAVIVLAAAASAATGFFLSLFLQRVRGLTPLEASTYFLPMLLIVAAGSLSGRLMRRFSPMQVATAGLGGTSLSLFLLALWMDRGAAAAIWPALFLQPLGLGLSFSGPAVAALAGVPDHQRGLAGGVVNTAMEVGPTVGLAALLFALLALRVYWSRAREQRHSESEQGA